MSKIKRCFLIGFFLGFSLSLSAKEPDPSVVLGCKLQTFGLNFPQTPVSKNDCATRLKKARNFQLGTDKNGQPIRVTDISSAALVGGGLFALDKGVAGGRSLAEIERAYREDLEEALQFRIKYDAELEKAGKLQHDLQTNIYARDPERQLEIIQGKLKATRETKAAVEKMQSLGHEKVYAVQVPNDGAFEERPYTPEALEKELKTLAAKSSLTRDEKKLQEALMAARKKGLFNVNGHEVFWGEIPSYDERGKFLRNVKKMLTSADKNFYLEDAGGSVSGFDFEIRQLEKAIQAKKDLDAAKLNADFNLGASLGKQSKAQADYKQALLQLQKFENDNTARWVKLGKVAGFTVLAAAAGVTYDYIQVRSEKKKDSLLTEPYILGNGAAVETVCRNGFDDENPNHEKIAAAVNEAVQAIENCAAVHEQIASLQAPGNHDHSRGNAPGGRSK